MRVVFVSPFSPRHSPVANYTADLVDALQDVDSRIRCRIAAIDEPSVVRPYGPEVRWRIRQRDADSYENAAHSISSSNADVVSIQHDFSLFGTITSNDYHRGLYEDHLRPFLENLTKPAIVTLHALPPRPSLTVKDAVRAIADLAQSVVVMSSAAVDLLKSDYDVDIEPALIPHGHPNIEAKGRTRLKRKLGLADRTIISTLGIVHSRKGIENVIHAMKTIVQKHPEVLYLIAGATDPDERAIMGDQYRNQLLALVDNLRLSEHVAFVDQHLTQRDVANYLLASDVYVAPHLDLEQVTSGTLAYAVGMGKAIVATKFSHAKELLSNGRGLLVDAGDSEQMADAVLRILEEPQLKEELEEKTRGFTGQLPWHDVGTKFRALLDDVAVLSTVPRRERRSPERPLDVGLGVRLAENPLLTPADVMPSLPELEVVSVFNAATAKVEDEILLLLRVAERPRTDIDPPLGAMTLDVNAPFPRLIPLNEGKKRDEVLGIAIFDASGDSAGVKVAYLPKDLPDLDTTDSRSIRFRSTAGGFAPGIDDYTQYLTQISHLRLARSRDGVHFVVDETPAVTPSTSYEEYGCEDARITQIDGKWYITYVAAARIGVTTHLMTTEDFVNFDRHGVMFLPDHKDVVLFPEKINGKYVALTRPMPQSFGHVHGIWIAFSDDLMEWGYHQPIALPRWGRWDEMRTGGSAVPFRVPEGWLELYHGVDRNTRYAMGALLLDADDPTKVLGRSPRPILVPSEYYEKSGFFNDTVFSCGHIALDDENEHIRLYYGAADSVTGAADFSTRDIIDHLERY